MQLSIMQSRESGDAGKPGRMTASRRNIRRTSASPNMLSMLPTGKIPGKTRSPQGPLTQQLWAFPPHQLIDAKSWMSKARKLSAMTLESCSWMAWLNKLAGKKCGRHRVRLSLPHRRSSLVVWWVERWMADVAWVRTPVRAPAAFGKPCVDC